MTVVEAVTAIKDWSSTPIHGVQNGDADAEKLMLIKSIWTAAQPLRGSIGEHYLDETRHIDVTKLPEDIHRSLRFHPNCVFGPGTYPCLIALMRDPLTDKPVGIQRIALEHRTARSRRSSAACSAMPASSNCGRPGRSSSSAKDWKRYSRQQPAFPTPGLRSSRRGQLSQSEARRTACHCRRPMPDHPRRSRCSGAAGVRHLCSALDRSRAHCHRAHAGTGGADFNDLVMAE